MAGASRADMVRIQPSNPVGERAESRMRPHDWRTTLKSNFVGVTSCGGCGFGNTEPRVRDEAADWAAKVSALTATAMYSVPSVVWLQAGRGATCAA